MREVYPTRVIWFMRSRMLQAWIVIHMDFWESQEDKYMNGLDRGWLEIQLRILTTLEFFEYFVVQPLSSF